MRRRRARILVAVWLGAAGQAQAQSGCNWSRAPFCDGCTVDRHISATADAVCIMRSTTGNRVLVGRVSTVRPKNGTVGQDGPGVRAYRPNPGFRGSDYFEDQITFEENGRRKSMTVRNHVTVR